jgi:type IV pilus assembly protein PilY1
MTTFVVGLGLDSSLAYRPDYRTATEGDFWDIRRGVKNWPVTGTGTGFDYLEKMNDMWHAAVNGRGTYFSAKNPQELLDALQTTLSTIGAANGTGAAAALSSLYPVEGDNYTYIANYRTVHWDGDLLAYAIDVNTNELDTNALWSAQKILDGKITGDCGDNSMGRTIYFSKPEGSTATLKEFRWTNLDSTQQGYFDASKVGELSQFQSNAALASQSAGARLVDYLRGENRYEKRTRNSAFQTACAGPAQAVYRAREHVLGDIVHAAPAYVGQPAYDYSDSGYAAFKNDSANRINKTIYVGANEGILHAFDAVNGAERWAYIPPKVMPNLYKLADEHYSKKHLYSVNGPIVTGDINVGGSSWKTILVGALGKGGRSIYALDITDNRTPKPLWTFENDNLGYTYGLPRITKLKDGTWVVVIASGYNNINPGNGEGHVFVINAATGGLIKTLSTGAGDTGTPSGLAALNGYVPEVESDNTVLRIYGGDLNGNLWGFDINSGRVYKIASGLRPITAPPQVSHVDNDSYVALFFGTGRYLGQTDLKVLPEMTGTIYAIKDKTILPGGTETSAIPLVSTSELTKVTGSATGTVNWLTGSGWYYPLPRTGERVAISAQKYLDTLVVASVLPVALSSCEMGGTGYLYFFDAKNGTGGLHKEFSTPLAGVTIYQGLDKQGYVVTVGGDGTKVIMALPPPDDDGGGGGGGGGGGQASGSSTRIMWQESNSN